MRQHEAECGSTKQDVAARGKMRQSKTDRSSTKQDAQERSRVNRTIRIQKKPDTAETMP